MRDSLAKIVKYSDHIKEIQKMKKLKASEKQKLMEEHERKEKEALLAK